MGRMIKDRVPLLENQGKRYAQAIQREYTGVRLAAPAALALVVTLAACGGGGPSGQVIEVDGFAGLAAADEPFAATVGRDILGNGGGAADAAVAMYFTMAVTLPSRAGLGGGGVCVVFDREEEAGEVIDFRPKTTSGGGVVPGNTRGMAVLHARRGSQRWEHLLSRAENRSRFSATYSRALVRDIEAGQAKLRGDPETARILLGPGGAPPREGDKLEQLELVTVISGIRREGAGYFYAGPFAQRLAEASSLAGGAMTTDDVRGYTPQVAEAVKVPVGPHTAFFAPQPAYGGTAGALIWSLLTELRDYGDAGAEEQATLLAAASLAALGGPAAGGNGAGVGLARTQGIFDQGELQRLKASYRPEPAGAADPGAAASEGAGFVVADQWGTAVACSFTMNGLFGSGRTARGTGLLLAAADRSNAGPTSPVILANENNGEFFFAASAGGGAAGIAALSTVMLEAVAAERPLAEAVARGRIQASRPSGTVLIESRLSAGERAALAAQGLQAVPVDRLGRVNAVHCPRGLRRDPDECQVVSDPRGWGLARRAE